MDPQEVMAFIKQARMERREDLDEISKSHASQMATNILLTNQASLAARLINADPNAPVDVTEDITDANFTTPPTET